jgi:hypothetical protein
VFEHLLAFYPITAYEIKGRVSAGTELKIRQTYVSQRAGN